MENVKELFLIVFTGGLGLVPMGIGLILIAIAAQPNVVFASLGNRLLMRSGKFLFGICVTQLFAVPVFILLLAGALAPVYIFAGMLVLTCYWSSLPLVHYFKQRHETRGDSLRFLCV